MPAKSDPSGKKKKPPILILDNWDAHDLYSQAMPKQAYEATGTKKSEDRCSVFASSSGTKPWLFLRHKRQIHLAQGSWPNSGRPTDGSVIATIAVTNTCVQRYLLGELRPPEVSPVPISMRHPYRPAV